MRRALVKPCTHAESRKPSEAPATHPRGAARYSPASIHSTASLVVTFWKSW